MGSLHCIASRSHPTQDSPQVKEETELNWFGSQRYPGCTDIRTGTVAWGLLLSSTPLPYTRRYTRAHVATPSQISPALHVLSWFLHGSGIGGHRRRGIGEALFRSKNWTEFSVAIFNRRLEELNMI